MYFDLRGDAITNGLCPDTSGHVMRPGDQNGYERDRGEAPAIQVLIYGKLEDVEAKISAELRIRFAERYGISEQNESLPQRCDPEGKYHCQEKAAANRGNAQVGNQSAPIPFE